MNIQEIEQTVQGATHPIIDINVRFDKILDGYVINGRVVANASVKLPREIITLEADEATEALKSLGTYMESTIADALLTAKSELRG